MRLPVKCVAGSRRVTTIIFRAGRQYLSCLAHDRINYQSYKSWANGLCLKIMGWQYSQ